MLGVNVLLIEDNPGDAKLVQIMLSEANLECKKQVEFYFSHTESLAKAFESIDETAPDVVLLDLGLPDSSGVETVKKAVEKIPNIPIIAHTGMDDIHVGMEAVRLGAVGYIVKGESTPSLLAKNILFALEQYKLKKEIEKKELFLSTLIENAPIPMFYKDVNGLYLGCNHLFLAMFGYERQEIIGKSVYDVAPQGIAKRYNDEDSELLNNPITPQVYEYVVKNRQTGKLHDVIFHKSAFFNADGRVAGLIGAIVDITEKKRIDKEYKKQEEMLVAQSRQAAMGEMIGMIAHQWRQPITAIGMAVNNLKADMELGSFSSEDAGGALDDIGRLIDHLSKTIDDFRDFFKIEREKDEANIDTIINDVLRIVGKSLENNNIAISIDLNTKGQIKIFKREMIQVFLNIIKNAKDAILEAKPTNPTIKISSKETDSEVVIVICDNGGGISEDAIGHLFEPYFTTKGPTSGTGLGLYMSDIIVKGHHGGKIEVANVGGGACFTVRLPLVV